MQLIFKFIGFIIFVIGAIGEFFNVYLTFGILVGLFIIFLPDICKELNA